MEFARTGVAIVQDPGGRMDRISAEVRELSPQLVLLQEVWLIREPTFPIPTTVVFYAP